MPVLPGCIPQFPEPVLQPPCSHTAGAAFPPCCLFPFIWASSFPALQGSQLCFVLDLFFFFIMSFFPSLIFLALSFCLPSFILHARWFSHLLPSAQFSFPFSLSISSDPQAIYLIASPFSSSTGSFHLLTQFVSKQQMSILYLLPNCCLSQIVWRRKRDIETIVFISKLTHHMLWFPFVFQSFQGTFSSV